MTVLDGGVLDGGSDLTSVAYVSYDPTCPSLSRVLSRCPLPFLAASSALPYPGPALVVAPGPRLEVRIGEHEFVLADALARFAASRGLDVEVVVGDYLVPRVFLPQAFWDGTDPARSALAVGLVEVLTEASLRSVTLDGAHPAPTGVGAPAYEGAGLGQEPEPVRGTGELGKPGTVGSAVSTQELGRNRPFAEGHDVNFILGLDLDGVCGDYISEFRRYVSRSLGTPESQLPDPAVWDFTDAGWGITSVDHFKQLHADAVRDGLFRSMPAMAGISPALWELSDAGVFIRIITHRLVVNKLHAIAAADTVTWLDRHDIPFRDLCFVGAKAQVDASVYIDDAPHNVIALARDGKDVIVFDASYNKVIIDPETGVNYSDLPRVYNWDQAKQAILARKATWDAQATALVG